MSEGVFKLSEIEEEEIYRIPTGFDALDRIYGGNDNGINYVPEYGLPLGKISVWSGPSGIGKTRIAISITSNVCNTFRFPVLMFQNEVPPSEFKYWVKGKVNNPELYFVSNYSSLESQMEAIRQVKPRLAIVDSINMIDGFSNPTHIRDIMTKYKEVVGKERCHVIFIGHMNKLGDLKGNNDVEYLADIMATLIPHKNGIFILQIDKKNRYGRIGGWVAFTHTDTGIKLVCSCFDVPLANGKTQQIVNPILSNMNNTLPPRSPLKEISGNIGLLKGLRHLFLGG
jgi:DNA repair protein RadA/Sms